MHVCVCEHMCVCRYFKNFLHDSSYRMELGGHYLERCNGHDSVHVNRISN